MPQKTKRQLHMEKLGCANSDSSGSSSGSELGDVDDDWKEILNESDSQEDWDEEVNENEWQDLLTRMQSAEAKVNPICVDLTQVLLEQHFLEKSMGCSMGCSTIDWKKVKLLYDLRWPKCFKFSSRLKKKLHQEKVDAHPEL